MRAMAAHWLWNPIVEKEVRSRMRSWRAPCVITVFIAVLTLIGYGALTVAFGIQSVNGGSISPQAGLGIFIALSYTELILIVFLAPALTAGAISGERERQTLDLLLCTRVRPAAIILGKLLASLLFVILLIFISIPVFAFVFLFGGIDIDQIFAVVLIGLVTALVLGSISLLCSSLARGSTSSTVASYVLSFVFLVAPFVATIFVLPLEGSRTPFVSGTPVFWVSDPLFAVGAVLNPISGTPRSQGPTIATKGVNTCVTDGNGVTRCSGSVAGGGPGLSNGGAVVPAPNSIYPNEPFDRVEISAGEIVYGPLTGFKVWQVFLIVNLVVAAPCLGLATLALGRRRLPRRSRPAPPPLHPGGQAPSGAPLMPSGPAS